MAGSASLKTRACSCPVNPAAVRRPDTRLAQGAQLDLALADLLVLRDQNPFADANRWEPVHVLRATPEGVVLHVRDVSFATQHVRHRSCCDALIQKELVPVIRRLGRA